MSPTSPATRHEAPATHNLTLVASGGQTPTPPTGHLTLATTHGRTLPHLHCPHHPCTDPGPHHGELAKYKAEGCRCTPCTRANTAHKNHRERLLAYGTWQPLVDAEPARAHVRELRAAGLTRDEITRRAGVSEMVIRKLLSRGTVNPPTRRMRPDNAVAILGVPVPRLPAESAARIDATGTRRRMRALVAVGYPCQEISRQTGLDVKWLFWVLYGRVGRVESATARAVALAYDRLWGADPSACGLRRQDVRLSQERAVAHGWAPPLGWDEDPGSPHCIDDPAGWPDWTGMCGQPGGAHAHIAAGSVPCVRCAAVPFGAECGTRRGYDEHRELGTETCRECRDVINDAARGRKERRRARQGAAA